MFSDFPLFPDSASTFARSTDLLYLYLVAVATFFSVLIFLCIFYFAIKYRRRSEDERPRAIPGSLKLEIAWSVIPLVLAMAMFAWGASIYFTIRRPPTDAEEIFVVGKQWMWKIQHPQGPREINELHIPVGRAIKLTMTSEDVIHSFFVPAFRVKQDVVPGRYQSLWFQATKVGTYHLFCAEYCGTNHSAMIGRVVVMEPEDYENWLSGGPPPESMEAAGQKLFEQMQCHTCHTPGPAMRCPSLDGLFGRRVQLQGGQTVVANEAYLRESILNSRAKVVAGYQPVMPTYQGQLTEEQVLQLIAYIKSLGKKGQATP
jgi:cytochrome c oxidase subunit 2